MKVKLFYLLLLVTSVSVFGQTKPKDQDKYQLFKLVDEVKQSIINKDSTQFDSLFINDVVGWKGVYTEASYQHMLKTNPLAKQSFNSDFKKFIRSLNNKNKYEEKFLNVVIDHDKNIGSVSLDYSFWINDVKINWGKEIWTVIKTSGNWKIASVLFSIQLEKVETQAIQTTNRTFQN